jgi:hypothetical protein
VSHRKESAVDVEVVECQAWIRCNSGREGVMENDHWCDADNNQGGGCRENAKANVPVPNSSHRYLAFIYDSVELGMFTAL